MNKTIIAVAAIAIPAIASAQSAVDAYRLSQTELRGTARFMAMGGAFTALGGDLSTLNQNPAGIGVYRRSEIGATLDISPNKITSVSPTNRISQSQTKAYCNNFGYVGTAQLDGAMRSFSWGASYNRVASFDRVYDVYNGATSSSLSNYIAAFTGNTAEGDLDFGSNYNPYTDSDCDWLSILAYSTYMINPTASGKGYNGLFQNGTQGDAYSQVRESGYVDEYAIDFGGNISDAVYWGVGFGITDLSYHQSQSYSESMADAYIASKQGMTTGDAGFELTNNRVINGSGWNFKVGLIARPINELRVGIAVHTPTWYSLSQSAYAVNSYSYYNPNASEDRENPLSGNEYTDDSYYNFRLYSPWKIMVGAAAVLGSQAIVSIDYEHQAYGDMKIKYQDQFGTYVNDDNVNDDISAYYKASNIVRIGAEYRVTPSFSVRAGYNYAATNVKSQAADGQVEVLTAGTDPSYTMNKDTNAVSVGLGYRSGSFYIDGTYIHRERKSTYHAYTDYADVQAPVATLTDTNNSVVLSIGFKF
jgi:hypothetical protein